MVGVDLTAVAPLPKSHRYSTIGSALVDVLALKLTTVPGVGSVGEKVNFADRPPGLSVPTSTAWLAVASLPASSVTVRVTL